MSKYFMLREHLAVWLEALRSGNYKQGNGALRDVDATYCCLGVWCAEARNRYSVMINLDKGLPAIGELPVWDKTKVLQNDPIFKEEEVRSVLGSDLPDDADMSSIGCCVSALNDRTGLSFEQIARVLEAYITPVDEIPGAVRARLLPHLRKSAREQPTE